MAADNIGPDVVVAGSARSGTSYLAAMLGRHSQIDPGALKEPGFFSARWGKGAEWYDKLFAPRAPSLLRLDASVAYTFPQYPEALNRLQAMAPHASIIYVVREPIARFVSMYQLYRYYASPKMFESLAEALELESEFCLLSGDYSLWLERIAGLFPLERVLVVPFPLITTDASRALNVLLPWLGLRNDEQIVGADNSRDRNEVRQFRWRSFEQSQRWIRERPLYLALRSAIGQDRLRVVRRLVTRSAAIPTPAEELASLSGAQRHRLDAVAAHAVGAASGWLRDQDRRYGLNWTDVWLAHLDESPPS